jgi:uncharacterized protein (DUF1778 family)
MADTKSSKSNSEKRLKGERLEARLTSEQKELLQRAAQLEGTTLTDFVVRNALSIARQVIEEHNLIKLSLEDSQAFARTLLNPSEPNARMMAAAKEYKHSMGLE